MLVMQSLFCYTGFRNTLTMPHVPDSLLKDMISKLPEEQQQAFADILSGKISHDVTCLDCGNLIAHVVNDGIDSRGRPKLRVQPVVDVHGNMHLHASRKRLDGFFGFQCACGNDSRIAAQEAAQFKNDGNPPTRDGLEEIYRQLQSSPADYPEIDGMRLIDGFKITRIAQ